MKSARASRSSRSTFSTPRCLRPLRRQEGIEGDDPHLQADGALGDDRADIAAADDAERLAGDLDAHEAVLLPLAGLGGGVGGGDFPGQGEHQRDGVLGGGDGIAERRVHDNDAARRGGGNVDIVDADAGAADHVQVLGGFEDLGGDLGRRADGEAVVIADDRGELVLVLAERRLKIDLDAALLENGDGGGRQGIRNEHTRRHVFSSPGRAAGCCFARRPEIIFEKAPAARRVFAGPGGGALADGQAASSALAVA